MAAEAEKLPTKLGRRRSAVRPYVELHIKAAFGQASHVPEAIVMPPQSASDTVEISEYEITICVLQDHRVGFVNDTCRAHSAHRGR